MKKIYHDEKSDSLYLSVYHVLRYTVYGQYGEIDRDIEKMYCM